MKSSDHCNKPFYKLFVAFFEEFYLCSAQDFITKIKWEHWLWFIQWIIDNIEIFKGISIDPPEVDEVLTSFEE